jgi:ubiquinone/menaquinone biosynthesis C-methylase UbiE
MTPISPVEANIASYSKSAATYDDHHPEIFNRHEQARLHGVLERARDAIESGGIEALDYGCGSGNLTRHLRQVGLHVTAADVTPQFLAIVRDRFAVDTIELVDGHADCVPSESFDLIAMYSVLHHIPDYLAAVRALVGKLRPGGVLVIEHERHLNHYFPPCELTAFRRENEAARPKRFWEPDRVRWQYLVRASTSPTRHIARWQRWRGRAGEIDIHVHAHDHIEWDRVTDALCESGAEIVERNDHLMFHDDYDEAVWERWRDRTCDQSGVIARRLRR